MTDIINYFDYKNINIPKQVIEIIENSTSSFLSNITRYLSNALTNFLQALTKIPIIGIYIAITILSTYFICTDKFYILDQLEHHLPRRWVMKMNNKLKKIVSTLGNYLKAEMILVLITFIIVLVGLYVLRFLNYPLEYPLLIALGIGFIDALPILRFRHCFNSLGYLLRFKWKFKPRYFINNNICNYSYYKATYRA